MTIVQWSQIEAECGDYRAGFVETFRKYEGADTDERTVQNKIVKVTAASFARHLGIRERTFVDWLKRDRGAPPAPRDHAGAARRFADKLTADEKAKLAAELLEDDDVAEQVEQHQIAKRGPTFGPLPEPAEAGRRAGDNMARQLGTDLATGALRSAAGSVAEAILCKEQFGIRNPAEYAEALARLRHLVAAIEADDKVSDDDRSWLASIGVDL